MNIFKAFCKEIKEEIQDFYLSRSEKALVATLVCLLLMLFFFTVMQISSPQKEILLEMQTVKDDFPDPQQQIAPEPDANSNVTTEAYNQADASTQHSEEVFKTLEELMQEKENASAQNPSEENLSPTDEPQGGQPAEPTEPEPAEPENNETNQAQNPSPEKKSASVSNQQLVNKNSLVRYYLKNRNAVDLPKPVFTCDSSGTVVINIKVNAQGEVIEAYFNQASSTTSNGCLVENATAYARRAHFEPSKRAEQLGSITYIYPEKK